MENADSMQTEMSSRADGLLLFATASMFSGCIAGAAEPSLINDRIKRAIDSYDMPLTKEVADHVSMGDSMSACSSYCVEYHAPYVVQKGDTLYGLSWKYGVSVDYIKRHNDLVDDTIKVGQELSLPRPAHYYCNAMDFYFVGEHPWVMATDQGFYSTLIENEEYMSTMSIKDPQEIVYAVRDFNGYENPEWLDDGNDETTMRKGSFVWVPNDRYVSAFVEIKKRDEALKKAER